MPHLHHAGAPPPSRRGSRATQRLACITPSRATHRGCRVPIMLPCLNHARAVSRATRCLACITLSRVTPSRMVSLSAPPPSTGGVEIRRPRTTKTLDVPACAFGHFDSLQPGREGGRNVAREEGRNCLTCPPAHLVTLTVGSATVGSALFRLQSDGLCFGFGQMGVVHYKQNTDWTYPDRKSVV